MICLHPHALTEAQEERIRKVLAASDATYGADFDFSREIAEQLVAVRALRAQILAGNRVREGVSSRDVRELISASSTLLSNLMKTHEKVQSFERQRKIEEALIEVLAEFGLKDEFMRRLEEKLP